MARHLEMRDLRAAMGLDVGLGDLRAGLQHDPCTHHFAEGRVGHAEHLHLLHGRVREQELLDLSRVDVFAAADQHVLDPAHDVAVALGVERGEVAGVHPAVDHRFKRALLVAPVAVHHGIAAGAQFALLAHRHRVAQRVDQLDLEVRLHPSDGADAALQRVGGIALERHRAGLGHAVGDRDLVHVHFLDDPLHHFDRAGRAGHAARAQAAQVVLRKVGMVELRDEHRRHAVQRGAAFGGNGRQRQAGIEALARKHHRRARGQAHQHAHHHAEAVVERHRYRQPVVDAEAHRRTHADGVVDDVVVRQRGALRVAGGAAGELHIDRLVRLQRRADGQRRPHAGRVGQCVEFAPIHHARRGDVAQPDDQPQLGQPRAAQLARTAGVEFGREGPQHRQVVRALELRGRHQRLQAGLVDGVIEFRDAVGRVDVHQDHAQPRGRQHRDEPLGAVGRPDAEPVALHEPQPVQRGRMAVHGGLQFAPRPAHAVLREDDGEPVGKVCRAAVEQVADGQIEQRRFGRAHHVRQAVTGRLTAAAVVRCLEHKKSFQKRRHRRPPGRVRLCDAGWSTLHKAGSREVSMRQWNACPRPPTA